MAILYLDEAGNTGLKDANQPYLIYGGVMVAPSNWKTVEHAFTQIQQKYISLLFSRIDQINNPAEIGRLMTSLEFFQKFHFHSAKIINRTGLWAKLDASQNEHFKLLEELIEIICVNNVEIYVGAIKKSTVQPTSAKVEYDTLLPSFFQFVDTNLASNNFMVIWDDGSSDEKELILKALKHSNLSNCVPELVTAKNLPMLQLADVVLWVTQYYLKLDASRTDDFAESVRGLYSKLQTSLKLHKIGF